MKMLKERMKVAGVILQEHELKYKAEKAWRDVKRAGINLNSIIPVEPGVEEHLAVENTMRIDKNLGPKASSQGS